MFDCAYTIDIQKLGFNVGTTFESLAGNLLKRLAEGINSILKFAGQLKLFRSNCFVYINADKLKELSYKLNIWKKLFKIF